MGDTQSTLAAAITERLTAQGMTKQALADQLGIAQPTVVRWTTGWSVPSEKHLKPLAKWLGLPLQRVSRLADEARVHATSSASAQARLIGAEVERGKDIVKRLGRLERKLDEVLALLRER